MTISPRQYSEIQAAAATVGIRPAARQFAQAFHPSIQRTIVDRIRQHARRHGWRTAHATLADLPGRPQSPNVARGLPALSGKLSQAAQDGRHSPATASEDPAPLVSGAEMIAAILAKRREKSALYLSHYVTSATRTLAGSKGNLDLADTAAQLARTRAALWPESATAAAGSEISVQLDDQGKVAQIHARLVAQLTGRPDDRLAGNPGSPD